MKHAPLVLGVGFVWSVALAAPTDPFAVQAATALNNGKLEVRLIWVPKTGWTPPGGVTVWRKLGTAPFTPLTASPIDIDPGSGASTAIAALRGTAGTPLVESFHAASVKLSSLQYFNGLKGTALTLKSQGMSPAQIRVGLTNSPAMHNYVSLFGGSAGVRFMKKSATATANTDPAHFRAQVILQAMTHPALAGKYGLGYTDTAPLTGLVTYEVCSATQKQPGTALPLVLGQVQLKVDNAEEMGPPAPGMLDGMQLDQSRVDLHWEPLISAAEEPKLGVVSYVVQRQDPATKAWVTINREPVVIGFRATSKAGTVVAPPTSFTDNAAPTGLINYQVTAYDSFGRASKATMATIKVDDLRTPDPIYRIVSRAIPPGQAPALGGNGLSMTMGQPLQPASAAALQTQSILFFLPSSPNAAPTAPNNLTPTFNVYRKVGQTPTAGLQKILIVSRGSLTPLGAATSASSSDMTLLDFCNLFDVTTLLPAYKAFAGVQQTLVFDAIRITSLQKLLATAKAAQSSSGSSGSVQGPTETTAQKAAAVAAVTAQIAAAYQTQTADKGTLVTVTSNLNNAIATMGTKFGWTSAQNTAVEGVLEGSSFTNTWAGVDVNMISIAALMGMTTIGHGTSAGSSNPQATAAWNVALNRVEEFKDPTPPTDSFATYSVSSLYAEVKRESVQIQAKPVPIPLYVAPAAPASPSGTFARAAGQFGFLDPKGKPIRESRTLPQGRNSLTKLAKMTRGSGSTKRALIDPIKFQSGVGFVAPSNGTLGGQVTLKWSAVPQTIAMRYDVYRAIDSGWVAAPNNGTPTPTPPTYYLDLPAGTLTPASWVKLGETQSTAWTDALTRSNATHYLYHVVAVNRWGVAGAASPDVAVHVPGLRPPSVPSVVSVNPGELGGIKLIWRPTPADEQVSKYLVLRMLQTSADTLATPRMLKTKNPELGKFGITPTMSTPRPNWVNLTDPGVLLKTTGKPTTINLTPAQLALLDVTGYEVVGTVPFDLAHYDAGAMEFLDTSYPNPLPGQQYLYRMEAVNSDGVASDGSLPISVEPIRVKADPVTGVTATAATQGGQGVVLTWTAPYTGAVNYLIYRSLYFPATVNGGIGSGKPLNSTTITAPKTGVRLLLTTLTPPDGVLSRLKTTYTDSSVRTGQYYTYQVVARDGAGRISDPVQVTIGPIAHP